MLPFLMKKTYFKKGDKVPLYCLRPEPLTTNVQVRFGTDVVISNDNELRVNPINKLTGNDCLVKITNNEGVNAFVGAPTYWDSTPFRKQT